MKRTPIRVGIAGLSAAVFLAGGAAVASSQSSDERQAFLDEAASRLGVDADRLEDALEQAAIARVDAAVAAGRLSREMGEKLKEHIRSGMGPILGPPVGFRHHGPLGLSPTLSAAAEYLGVTRAELRQARREGKSLADLAREQGKSVEGLEDAMVAAAKKRLDAAVQAGRLTAEQRARILEGFEARIGSIVEATHRGPPELGPRGLDGPRRFRHWRPALGESSA
jgi:hypothetical protein